MKINNQPIIRKITGRALRSDRRRNFFIVAAIALTAFLITSVFSVGMSYYETIMISPFRPEGIFAHTFLMNQTSDDVETLRSLSYVRRVASTYRVGVGHLEGFEGLDGFDQGVFIAAVNEDSWRYNQAPVYSDIIGSVAKAENEIMLSRAHLERMGIDEPHIGMEIPMDFAIGDYAIGEYGERHSETFILSAIYTEYVSLNPGNVGTPIFVSEAFAERYGQLSYENRDVRIIFTNQSRAAEYTKRLAQDLNMEEKEVALHPALSYHGIGAPRGSSPSARETGSSTMYISISIIVIFFMLVGFLLIYNVMYLSVSKDVRFYGLLKTMGTTPRQLRRIVNGQVLIMYVIGLPVGLAAAFATSFVLVPAMMTGSGGTVISFSPLIYIGGAVFALITAYIGASISAKKAAKVSPIEATRYTGAQNVNFKARLSSGGKVHRMAWRNMFRQRRRALTVLFGLFLGITVFTVFMSIALGMDIAANIDYLYDADIIISNASADLSDFGLIGMDRDFIEEIWGIPGVSEVREQTMGFAEMFEYPPEIEELLIARQGYFQPLVQIAGIGRAYMEELNERLENPIDIEAFERGEIVLVDKRFGEMRFGDMFYEYFPVGADLYFEFGGQATTPVDAENGVELAPFEPIPVNTKIAEYADIHIRTGYSIHISGCLEIIMSNTFLDSIFSEAGVGLGDSSASRQPPGVSSIGIIIEEGMEEPVNAAVAAIAKEHGLPFVSAYEAQRAEEEVQFVILVLGLTLSGILALIGLFNFINLISVGLLTRKRELAALESVGMTGKQMRLMLRWEGAIYWILTIAASVTAGTGIAYGLFWLVQNQDPILMPQFIYPVLPVAVVFGLIVLICTATPEICYRGMSKMTLVERLREAE